MHLFVLKYLRILEDVPWVATTADCWTGHHNSYLGSTVHWLDPETRERKQAVLACMRLKGSHTFNVLAHALSEIHSKFQLQDKVRRTTTDNGSNFVKAFVHFGEDAEVLPEVVPDDGELLEDDPVDFVELVQDPDTIEVQPEVIEIEEIFEMGAAGGGQQNILPAHMRCAAHTLNLVATTDASAAMLDSKFKTASRKAMGKAQALWNAQSRSTVMADIIQAELKRRLVVPNATRWNATYDAVVVINNILSTNRKEIANIVFPFTIPAPIIVVFYRYDLKKLLKNCLCLFLLFTGSSYIIITPKEWVQRPCFLYQ